MSHRSGTAGGPQQADTSILRPAGGVPNRLAMTPGNKDYGSVGVFCEVAGYSGGGWRLDALHRLLWRGQLRFLLDGLKRVTPRKDPAPILCKVHSCKPI
jgi:hypothetical protein